MLRRKRRVVFRGGVIVVLGLLALVFALPVWFPWALRPIATSQGVTYATYERDGYTGFRLKRVTLATASGTFNAQEVNGLVPSTWLWKLAARETNAAFCRINSWQFVG